MPHKRAEIPKYPKVDLALRNWEMLVELADRRGISAGALANYILSQWLERALDESRHSDERGNPPVDRRPPPLIS